MELTTFSCDINLLLKLFMMSKIQKLNGTHNIRSYSCTCRKVVYDVKDTKIEWNSQRYMDDILLILRCL